VTIQPFDHDAWRGRVRDDWRRLGLHWHCYNARMDPDAYGKEGPRRDLSTALPPKVLKDWLRKPASAVKQIVTTPDDGLAWLREQCRAAGFDPIGGQDAYGRALLDLQGGTDVCWGGWLGTAAYLHLTIVGTAARCHTQQ
jgi:hypothetical protein